MSERLLLRIKDVAALLGINRHQVARLVAERKIAVVEIPGMKQYRFTREAVDEFIQTNTTVRDEDAFAGECPALPVVRSRSEPHASRRQLPKPYPKDWEKKIRR